MKPHKLSSNSFVVKTSAEWYAYYKANSDSQLKIPWELGAGITEDELKVIASSLSAWQLGETSDGTHLLAAAKEYAKTTNDPEFVDVVHLFIKEEQRHGNMLGRFLDLAGIPRIKQNWGDTAFRFIRYLVPKMEAWVTPVIMIEILALIYYKAIRNATKSRVLRLICQQILKDEVKHIRFQYERLAILHKNRFLWLRKMTYLLHWMLYFGITIAVWVGHHTALKAGGCNFRSYWRTAWMKMNLAWKQMSPERYSWQDTSNNERMVALDGLSTSINN